MSEAPTTRVGERPEDRPVEAGHEDEHASRGTYWLVALVLAIITLLEVAVFYLPFLAGILAPVLIVLSAAKFTLVVMFFMHLKYDKPILTGVFLGGLLVATVIVLALMILFGKFGLLHNPF